MFTLAVERNQWTPAFRIYTERWSDMTPTQRRIAWILKNEIKQNYLTEGGHAGIPWAQRTRPYPHPPLRKSMFMMRQQMAMTTQPWKKRLNSHTMDLSKIEKEATPYSRFHGGGTQFMPSRVTVAFSPHATNSISAVMADHTLVI